MSDSDESTRPLCNWNSRKGELGTRSKWSSYETDTSNRHKRVRSSSSSYELDRSRRSSSSSYESNGSHRVRSSSNSNKFQSRRSRSNSFDTDEFSKYNRIKSRSDSYEYQKPHKRARSRSCSSYSSDDSQRQNMNRKKFKSEKKCQNLTGELATKLVEMKQLRDQLEANKSSLEEDSSEMKSSFSTMFTQLRQQLRVMRQNTLQTMAQQHIELDEGMKEELGKFDRIIEQMQHETVSVRDDENNRKKRDTLIKQATKLSSEYKLLKTQRKSLRFIPYDNKALLGIDNFGVITVVTKHISNVEDKGTFTVKMTDDKLPCKITGMCFTGGRTLLVVDNANEKLKEYTITEVEGDIQFKYLRSMEHKAPFDICCTGTEAVLSSKHTNELLYISTLTLKVIKFVSAGRELRGTCYNGTVNVLCTVRKNSNVLRKYTDSGGFITDTEAVGEYITTNNDHSKLYIAGPSNEWNKCRSIRVYPDSKYYFYKCSPEIIETENLKNPKGMCMDEKDNLYVCCQDSENVAKFNMKGEFQEYLSYVNGRLHKPTAITYGKSMHLLIVGGQDNFLQFLKLK